ncbi:MAG: family 43 glycosylhydrolase, partial [Lachnospiraceae bacterium]|nr:family 43 glycosylhydrolase [Lachnospiraceae bacterium]
MEEETMDFEAVFKDVKLAKTYKGFMNNNPIIEQHYGADPFALVYDDTVYFYMTADAYEYDEKKEIKENSYSKIRSLYVVSTKDMINFTDHGEIMIAGANGATKWAHNSWAPAAAWKMIDGKPKFFLYFADNGGGIGVVCADSPVGPFRDELGKGLIRRDMENCGNVEWLFDPAVLVDDDGKAYIYFGGGVPKGKAAHPMTGRCA